MLHMQIETSKLCTTKLEGAIERLRVQLFFDQRTDALINASTGINRCADVHTEKCIERGCESNALNNVLINAMNG